MLRQVLNYNDHGAAVTDNVDQNLGYKSFLNGTLVSDIVIDTSAAATDAAGRIMRVLTPAPFKSAFFVSHHRDG
jgi:hypothetical protein